MVELIIFRYHRMLGEESRFLMFYRGLKEPVYSMDDEVEAGIVAASF